MALPIGVAYDVKVLYRYIVVESLTQVLSRIRLSLCRLFRCCGRMDKVDEVPSQLGH